MKKTFLFLIFIVLAVPSLSAASDKNAFLGQIKMKQNTDLMIFVSVHPKKDKNNEFRIHVTDANHEYIMRINLKNRHGIIAAIHKYLEWEEIARNENVTITKTMKRLVTDLRWPYGGSFYTPVLPGGIWLTPGIASQDTSKYYFTLALPPEVPSAQNRYITLRAPALHFTKEEALALLELLGNEENISAVAEEARNSVETNKENSKLFK